MLTRLHREVLPYFNLLCSGVLNERQGAYGETLRIMEAKHKCVCVTFQAECDEEAKNNDKATFCRNATDSRFYYTGFPSVHGEFKLHIVQEKCKIDSQSSGTSPFRPLLSSGLFRRANGDLGIHGETVQVHLERIDLHRSKYQSTHFTEAPCKPHCRFSRLLPLSKRDLRPDFLTEPHSASPFGGFRFCESASLPFFTVTQRVESKTAANENPNSSTAPRCDVVRPRVA
ncbi:hypothetical protein AVEN_253048-1 [Araneus ventricosus]|uniref:Uncharacterized protein n=1 Tax=Araneus ventricosus TaxID=182803 RepID=A0A4Y2UP80_ARAVE|nr:hypothetical protein AVEN_194730-1 [Araneus ventricosus]GBO13347.1 hypothetical protein AVEN_253048-1 [Araneus ventricosus]